MAGAGSIQSMNDVALKPRLLRSLLREYVPDQKHQFRNHSDLSYVVSAVKTHRLLSESAPPSTDQKDIDTWKAAVDAWVNRIVSLASNSMPDKCWAGICLLGVTCQECSSERFLASYLDWSNKLLSHIQPPAGFPIVKAASCASLSDLLSRLAGYPNEKKDGNSQATKIVQSVLKLINEDRSEVVWEEAICVISTIINVFPSSIQRQYDSVEAAIVSMIFSGKCSDRILKRFGHTLALLPKSKGDAESWFLMMQRILISINTQLNDFFQGLEEETRKNEAMKLLLPPGKEPPPSLGGHSMSGENLGQEMKRPELLLMSRISTLMECCCEMLTGSYPVQVSVPVRALIALVERVLMVDGSSSLALYPFLATMKLEIICSGLPLLHINSLELLSSCIRGLRSLLLPHIADIVRLLMEYLGRCSLPELRIKVYSIVKSLLLSMGVGIAVYLSQEVINNVQLDLDSFSSKRSHQSAEAVPQPRHKKRKHASTAGFLTEQSNRAVIDPETLNSTPFSLKIAALEALEALLVVGGNLRSENLRSNIDNLLGTVAITACKGGWTEEENSVLLGESTPRWADFQLAALRAFLASLISPSQIRPRYLGLGLELFRRGTQERGTRVAEFCGHALLTLEVLIHPRSLPLVEFEPAIDNYNGTNRLFSGTMYIRGDKQDAGYYSGKMEKGPAEPDLDHDDPLHHWLQSDEEMEDPQTDVKKIGRPEKASKVPVPERLTESEPGVSVAGPNERVTVGGDEIMVDLPHTQEASLSKGGAGANVSDGGTSVQAGLALPGNGELGHINKRSELAENVVDKSRNMSPILDKTVATESGNDGIQVENAAVNGIGKDLIAEKSKGSVFELENESSLDSIPDIVDGDPDSDYAEM